MPRPPAPKRMQRRTDAAAAVPTSLRATRAELQTSQTRDGGTRYYFGNLGLFVVVVAPNLAKRAAADPDLILTVSVQA